VAESRVVLKRLTRTATTSPTERTSAGLRGAGVECSGLKGRAQVIAENGTGPSTPGASSTVASPRVTAVTMPA
jgi:hypothetical protein